MAENQTVKDRLLIFMRHVGVGQAKFEKSCGLSNGYINNSKGNIGAAKLEDILQAYPDLNRVWLLTGEGEMLRSAPAVSQVVGDGNRNITQTVGSSDLAGELIALLRKRDEQIDRLIELLEARRE